MTRFARVAGAWAAAAMVLSTACRERVDSPAYHGARACAALDSLLASAGPPRQWQVAGEATIDVDQFRFRGHFQIDVSNDARDAVLQLGGSTLFGGHREDFVVSMLDDTLRVFDRERGRLYEGDALDALIGDATGAHADWARVLARVLASPGWCGSVESLVLDEDGARGTGPEGEFRAVVEGGRLTRSVWPDPTAARTYTDRLEIRYRWQDDRPQEITASLPERGWRVRFVVTKPLSAN